MEINIYLFYGLIEAVIVLAALAGYLYHRQKKFKAYFHGNVNERELHKRYLKKAIKDTRAYAKKLNGPAERGDNTAVKHRQHMVARLNWLCLERDFVCVDKPSDTYWSDINRQIAKLLERWQLVDFIDAPPSTEIVERSLRHDTGFHESPTEHVVQNKASVEFNYDQQAKKEIENLKKKVRNLNNYKALYNSQQSAYAKMVDSYKQLKQSLKSLEMESENAEKLKEMLSQHEMTENMMEQQMKEMEQKQSRLNAELEQLEAAFNLQHEELEKQHVDEQQQSELIVEKQKGTRVQEGELDEVHALIDQQNSAIRDLKTTVLSLKVDTDVRLELEDHIDGIEKNSSELQTCLQMLELERERLNSELTNLRHDETAEVSNMLNELDDLDDLDLDDKN